jgi:hypothetical protein
VSSLRWTPEQLENYRKRQEPRIVIDEPIAIVAQPQKVSKLERRFSQQLADNPDLPAHQRNYFFLADRDLELDFAWPAARIAVEVQGMAHRIKAKFKRDIESGRWRCWRAGEYWRWAGTRCAAVGRWSGCARFWQPGRSSPLRALQTRRDFPGNG